MRHRFLPILAALLLATAGGALASETVLMSSDWAAGMCDAWNQEPSLTTGLAKWMENDDDRGYKLLRIYRLDCPDSPRIQLRIADQEGAVSCVEGGLATDEELSSSCDYVMFAKTERWLEMGAGEYGPMWGMMSGRLKFQGPKWEAMKNMGPFKSFLLLVGKVPGSTEGCPTAPPVPDEPQPEADSAAVGR